MNEQLPEVGFPAVGTSVEGLPAVGTSVEGLPAVGLTGDGFPGVGVVLEGPVTKKKRCIINFK